MNDILKRSELLSIAAPALFACVLVGAPPAQAHAKCAPTEIELTEVLRKAREASNREAWSKLQGGLRLSGTSDTGAVDATFELYLGKQGQYRYESDGALGQTAVFDGRVATVRDRSGPTNILVLKERDTWQLSQWVHSGYWAEESAPLEIELLEIDPESVTLNVGFPDSPTAVSLELELDLVSWLPRRYYYSDGAGQHITSFSEYEAVAGIPIAHLVESKNMTTMSQARVLDAELAGPDEGQRYSRREGPALDTSFDPQKSAQVELKRVQSGHLLVHPLINGEDVGWFILDSGAGQSCIDPRTADALDMEEFGEVPALGVAGRVMASYRQGSQFELGPMQIRDQVYVELELAFLEPIFGVEIAGIVGFGIFARSVVELDLEELQLSLHDPAQYELDAGGWSELVLASRIPCIHCSFEGERSGLFKIDLGDSGTVSFYTPAVKDLGLLEGREVVPTQIGGVGGNGSASAGTLEWFEIGGKRTQALGAIFSQTEVGAFASSYALGNLGSQMLAPFKVVLDYGNARIALHARE